MTIDLLPRPRRVEWKEGLCRLARLRRAGVTGISPETVQRMTEDLPGVRFERRPGRGCRLVLAARGGGSPAASSDLDGIPADAAEGYALRIEKDRVTIHAREAAGVWQGFQTLLLVAQDSGGRLPCAVIRDWPAVKYRAIHIDLKGYQPTFSRLVEMIRLLARYKINAVLLELEDKFAYTSVPGVAVREAYTPAQLRELGRLAASMHVQIIPKIQCLAHVDYLLKHPAYAHLRENGHPYQYCPRNPEVHELWRGMADEVMDCLPGHRFFHVGADESSHLGECPVCRKHRKAANYVHVVGKAVDHVRRRGRRPQMWEDILRNAHGHLSEKERKATLVLGRKATLIYWAYGYSGEQDNNFPFLAPYRKLGLDVWGASGFSGCGPRWFQNVPDLQNRAWNIAAWTKSAVEHGLDGIITTGWTRIASFDPPTEVPEACWFQMIYAADSMWAGVSRNLDDFGRMAARSFFGVELPEHMAFLRNLDPQKLPADTRRFKATRQKERFELLNAVLDSFRHEQMRSVNNLNADEVRRAYHGLVGHKIADYRKWLFEGAARGLRDAAARQSQVLGGQLSRFYETSTVEEFVRCRFARDAEAAAELEALSRKSTLL